LKENLSVRKVEEIVRKKLESKTKIKKEIGQRDSTANLSSKELIDRFQRILGTKVLLKQKKNGHGEIIIQFYSLDELDRLHELFEIIEKNN
jgi:ParB family chromosome partitioning protein